VADTARDRRVLIAVAPRLLGSLLARQLEQSDLELDVVVIDDRMLLGDDLRFDIVVTTGLAPPRVRAGTVVQLPDRLRGDELASLVTTDGVERIRISELAGVVGLVNQLCPPQLPQLE